MVNKLFSFFPFLFDSVLVFTKKGYGSMFIIALVVVGLFVYSNKNQEIKVFYVSQEEILALEKSRIADIQYQDKKMFFGKAGDAANLIQEIAKEFEDKQNIVIYSEGRVFGKKAESISSKVHQRVIEKLKACHE